MRPRDTQVIMETETPAEEIALHRVWARKKGTRQFIPAAAAVLALASNADDQWIRKLHAGVTTRYAIGDCTGPDRISQPIGGGFRVGRSL